MTRSLFTFENTSHDNIIQQVVKDNLCRLASGVWVSNQHCHAYFYSSDLKKDKLDWRLSGLRSFKNSNQILSMNSINPNVRFFDLLLDSKNRSQLHVVLEKDLQQFLTRSIYRLEYIEFIDNFSVQIGGAVQLTSVVRLPSIKDSSRSGLPKLEDHPFLPRLLGITSSNYLSHAFDLICIFRDAVSKRRSSKETADNIKSKIEVDMDLDITAKWLHLVDQKSNSQLDRSEIDKLLLADESKSKRIAIERALLDSLSLEEVQNLGKEKTPVFNDKSLRFKELREDWAKKLRSIKQDYFYRSIWRNIRTIKQLDYRIGELRKLAKKARDCSK